MRIARMIEKTGAEGPGIRSAVWMQGCPHHCRGCYAVDTHSFEGGREIGVDELFAVISSASPETEGVTFLGGEPLAQAAELAVLLKKIKKTGLSVTVFTGFVYEDIERYGSPEQKEVLKYTDLLVDGPYIEEQRDLTRPLVGSSNQRFIFLTDRYSEKDIEALRNGIEIRIDPEGTVRINGMGDFPMMAELFNSHGMLRI